MLFNHFGVTNCEPRRHHFNKRKSSTVNHSKHINILQTISERDTYVRKTLFTTLAQRFFVVSAVRYENDLRQRLQLMLPKLSYNFHKGENKLLLINIIVMEWIKRYVLKALFVMFALHSLKVYFARNKNATVRFNFMERKTHIQGYHSI